MNLKKNASEPTTCLRVCFLKSGKQYYNHFTIHLLKSKIILNVVGPTFMTLKLFLSHI